MLPTICLSASQLVAGAKVIPSFYDFFPVNLNPGEIAGIKHYYTDKRNLEEIVLEYDMLNDWAKRFNSWEGRIRTKQTIKIIRSQH